MTKNRLFNQDIIIHSQSIKAIYYTTKFGEDLHFKENKNLEFTCEYDVLSHKENTRDHIILLEYNVIEPSKEEHKNEFHIIVEGHFEISEEIKGKLIDETKHFQSLSILLSFLRTAVFNITSMTASGAHQIPLINAEELHKKFIRKPITNKKVVKKKKIEPKK